jgi:DNA segregation ATPase FtsK/SpoIIIE-like protein
MAAPSIPGADRVGVSEFLTRRAAEALGLCLLAAALVVAVALWGYDPNDPSLNHASAGPSTNPLGHFGASIADVLLQTLGLAGWLIVLILPLWGLRLIFAKPLAWPWLPVAALPLALLATAAYLATWPLPDSWPFWVGYGGFVGDDYMRHRLEPLLGPELYRTITGSIALVLVIVAAGLSVRELWQAARALVLAPFRLGRRRLMRSEQDEPRWAQAIEQRYGAPPAPPRPRRPLAAGFSLIGRLVGVLAAPLRSSRWRAESEVDLKRTIDPAIAATESARRRRPQPARAEPRRCPPKPWSWSRMSTSSCRRSISLRHRASAAASAWIARASPRPPARSRRCWTISASAARSSTCAPARWSRSTSWSRRRAPARRA